MGGGGCSGFEFGGLEDDEVLVDGLEGGVGEARGAVVERAAVEDEVEPLVEGAGGKAVEEGFLVEAAVVEVGVGEGSAEAGVGEGLAAVDEFGLEGGVEIVPGDPVGDPL